MTWVAVAVGGGALLGGIINSNASQSAANTQASAANNATAQQLGMFNTVQGNMRPYMQAGGTALNQLMGRMNSGPGGMLSQFTPADLQTNMAPNYQFQLGQGMGAIQNQNAAMGGGMGGNAMAGMQNYAQNQAGNAYQQSFGNWLTGQNQIFNRLGTVAQLGQASGSNATLGGSAFAQGMANTQVGAANALAAGQIGQANALSSGITGMGNAYLLSNMMQQNPGASVP